MTHDLLEAFKREDHAGFRDALNSLEMDTLNDAEITLLKEKVLWRLPERVLHTIESVTKIPPSCLGTAQQIVAALRTFVRLQGPVAEPDPLLPPSSVTGTRPPNM